MLSLVQRVFWGPLTREENRTLPDIRPSELVAAAVLVVLMAWIGIRPNDFLDRIAPSVEGVCRSVAVRKADPSLPVSVRLPEVRR
jgi:NADH:ubiquinone oxidoreductase subunit 4 (subunit M)